MHTQYPLYSVVLPDVYLFICARLSGKGTYKMKELNCFPCRYLYKFQKNNGIRLGFYHAISDGRRRVWSVNLIRWRCFIHQYALWRNRVAVATNINLWLGMIVSLRVLQSITMPISCPACTISEGALEFFWTCCCGSTALVSDDDYHKESHFSSQVMVQYESPSLSRFI